MFTPLTLSNYKLGTCSFSRPYTIAFRPVFKGGLGGAIASGGNIKIRFRVGKILKWSKM